MEIPALTYFSCWSLISITSLKLGFISLHKEASHISPLTIFLLKRFLAICVCHSSTYALVHRSDATPTNHLKLSVLGFSFLFYVYISWGPMPLGLVLLYSSVVTTILGRGDTGLSIDFFIRSITFSLRVEGDTFFPVFVLVTAFFTAGVAAIFDGIYSHREESNRSNRGENEKPSMKRRMVELTASVLASLAFHMVVRFESLSHVLAFLWFAVAWLGCIALTMAPCDLGVSHLLVCNVLVGCVNRFGLSGPTWFAYAAAVVLFVLHSKLVTVRFVRDCRVVLW